MGMLDIQLWKIYLIIRQSSGRMLRMMMVQLVERRFSSSWMSLKEVWYLPHYVEVALKEGQ